ncbi:hypothetical protein JKI95_01340 [Corynebacterium aquatimens]|uniref:hypothetical protein n=1 Tax=Corynebacterium aquatimens TaxID=1190508 RepID=UPI002541C1E2|nr:hypothetical protein [Corynebacterium aquatimens]QYH19822.1 hypothetical protein JKI95_01340 [Corynebacterium aquatimens]
MFLDRDELSHMNVFLGRNAETVRLLGSDGEHVEFDVAEAKNFLTALVKNCDRATGLVTLEADADPRDLSQWERSRLVAETHMENDTLVADTGVYEDEPRELIDPRFGKQTYEVWAECGTEFLGRTNKLPLARKIAENCRKEGLPAVVCQTRRWFVPAGE